MSKKEPLPDLTHMGVIVGQEDDGSLFDLGRFGELETLGISAAERANRARDELIRRATIVLCRLDRNTTLADLKRLGKRGLRHKGIEFALDPKSDMFVIFAYDEHNRMQPRGRALFWIFLCLHVLQPGGGSPIFRGKGDDPIAGVQLRMGGEPDLIGTIQAEDWHSTRNTIWSEQDDQPE